MEKKSSKKKWYYLLFLIILFYYYATGETYYSESISNVIGRYLGNGKYIIMAVLVLNLFTMNIEDKKKRDIITWLSYSMYPTYLAIVFLIVLMRIGIFTENYGENIQLYFVNLTIFEMKIGLIGTYLLSLVIFSKNTYIYWSGLVFSIILILLMAISLFNHLVLKNFKKIMKEYSEKRKLERDEEIILEKIALKEALEKKEQEQYSKIIENIETKKEKKLKIKEEELKIKEEKEQYQDYEDNQEDIEPEKYVEYQEKIEFEEYKDEDEQEFIEQYESKEEDKKEREQKKNEKQSGGSAGKFAPVLRVYEVKGEKKIISLKKNIIEEKINLDSFFDDNFSLFDEELPPSKEEVSFLKENNRKKSNEEVEF